MVCDLPDSEYLGAAARADALSGLTQQGTLAQANSQGRVLLDLQTYGASQDTMAMSVTGEVSEQETLAINRLAQFGFVLT